VNGQNGSSHTSDLGVGVVGLYDGRPVGSYDGWKKTFNLAAEQTLVVAGRFTFDSTHTTFGPNTLLPGFLSVGSAKQDIYGLQGAAIYYAGPWYFGGAFGGDIGRGSQTVAATGGTGSYNISGYDAALAAGKVFTLFDNRKAVRSALPAKAPPKATSGGYAVQLDVRAYIGYSNAQAYSFTDSAAFIWGTEQMRFWDTGLKARLFATIPAGEMTWIPFVGASVDQQFGYRDALSIPTQVATPADTISYGSAQTFFNAQWGLNAQAANGITVGARGFYVASSEFSGLGGQVYLRYAFDAR
jgi:hypothetical protein